MQSSSTELLAGWVKMAINDIGREHVNCIWIGITQEIGKAHGRKRVFVAEGVFVEFDHIDELWIK